MNPADLLFYLLILSPLMAAMMLAAILEWWAGE